MSASGASLSGRLVRVKLKNSRRVEVRLAVIRGRERNLKAWDAVTLKPGSRTMLRRLNEAGWITIAPNYPSGHADLPALGAYMTQLRSITNEGQGITDRFVVWEYHGPLECEEVETILGMFERAGKAVGII